MIERKERAAWEKAHRVDWTMLPGGRVVSTVRLMVFLGEDERFETMVFPSAEDFRGLDCYRYGTVEEARKGHAYVVDKLLSGGGND